MRQPWKLNPNILLTEKCNHSCHYCFAKQKMTETKKGEVDVEELERIIQFLKYNNQMEIRLMGGEPTLHSRFKEIIDLAISNKLKTKLFTNGIFSSELANWMSEKGNNIEYLINISGACSGPESERKIIENNLKILQNSKIIGSITITGLDFEIKPIVEFLERNSTHSAGIGLAGNMISHNEYQKIAAILLRLVDGMNKIGILDISLNCGFIPCMFTQNQIEQIKKKNVMIIGWGCEGRFGAFDISTDLNIFPCFIAKEVKNKNIFDSKDLSKARDFCEQIMKKLILNATKRAKKNCTRCDYFKNSQCPGPCLGKYK